MAAPMANMLSRSTSSLRPKFLFHFASEHFDFKIPELKSIASTLGFDFNIADEKYDIKNPFLVVDLPSTDHARQLMARTVLVKSLFELWGQGSNRTQLYENLRKYPEDLKKPFLVENSSFRILIETFNRKLSQKEKVKKIEEIPLDAVDFKGKVNLKTPDHTFSLLEYYGPEGTPTPTDPYQLYFGRWICNGQRDRIQAYHLQNRQFIGNTSMDACLSLIMANMGRVKKNSLVFDPFVGTGSLLVASAHFGGYVMGTDIDYLLLHAKGKPSRHNQKQRAPDESIRANLSQYGLGHAYLDVLVADASKQDMWRHKELLDAIITDPPYGIREPAKKIRNADVEIPEKQSHIPQREQYQLSDIFRDLLNFSAKFLRLHGRLVYWFPVVRPEYSDSNIPRHPCLRLVANSEQPLTVRIGRRLITMEKIKEYQDAEGDVGATYDVDHFGDASFRERYFRSFPDQSTRSSPQRSPKLEAEHGDKIEADLEEDLKSLTVGDDGSTRGQV